jgi:hypothetical protein
VIDSSVLSGHDSDAELEPSDADGLDDRPLWERELAANPDDEDHNYQIARAFEKRASEDWVRIEIQRDTRRWYETGAARTGLTVHELMALDADHPVHRMEAATARHGHCYNCFFDPVHYSDGLCRPCHVYRLKYGEPPEGDILDRRLDRRAAKGSLLRSYTDR